jgi:hypothetical protein
LEPIMPIAGVLILSLITFSFAAFAVVLAWGDHQNPRHRRSEPSARSPARALRSRASPRLPKAMWAVEETGTPERTPVHA